MPRRKGAAVGALMHQEGSRSGISEDQPESVFRDPASAPIRRGSPVRRRAPPFFRSGWSQWTQNNLSGLPTSFHQIDSRQGVSLAKHTILHNLTNVTSPWHVTWEIKFSSKHAIQGMQWVVFMTWSSIRQTAGGGTGYCTSEMKIVKARDTNIPEVNHPSFYGAEPSVPPSTLEHLCVFTCPLRKERSKRRHSKNQAKSPELSTIIMILSPVSSTPGLSNLPGTRSSAEFHHPGITTIGPSKLISYGSSRDPFSAFPCELGAGSDFSRVE